MLKILCTEFARKNEQIQRSILLLAAARWEQDLSEYGESGREWRGIALDPDPF